MTAPRPPRSPFARAAARRRAVLLALLPAAAAALATAAAFFAVTSAEAAREREHFGGVADAVEARIQARAARQAADLRAVAGLFAASAQVTRAEFRAYVDNLRPIETQPGVRAVTYIHRVARDDAEAWTDRVRADGADTFEICTPGPDTSAPDQLVTLYVEPLAGNEEFLGLDVGSLRGSRAALEAAEGQGRTTVSPPVPGAPKATVVFYRAVVPAPLDDDGDRGHEVRLPSPPPDRRRAVGWVASIVDLGAFLGDALKDRAPDVDVEVFDGALDAPGAVLLFDADGHLRGAVPAPDAPGRRHQRDRVLPVGGRRWTIRTSALPGWTSGTGTPLRFVVLGLGALVSALVYLVVAAGLRTRRLAERLAQRATVHLERQAHALALARDDAMAGTRAKSDFIAAVSHEIRTPLNGVLGASQLLLESHLPVEASEQVRTIKTSAQALLAILNDILDVSRIEAGKLELVPEATDLREATEEVLDLLAPAAAERDVELVLRWAPDTPTHVVADTLRWKQVLLNLVGNAVKFTERGHVLVDARPAPGGGAGATQSGPGIELRVEDTGHGIPKERLTALFRRFSQADPAASRRQGGVGLGLVITRLLVERMGGRVTVESEPGRGSVFTVVLPLQRSTSTLSRIARLPPTTAVLVVDDAPVARRVAVEVVSALGPPVGEAADGATAAHALAKAAAEGRPYGVALLDHRLPDTDAFALARRLRADPATAGIRLVLVAPHTRAALPEEAKAAGFDAWIGKPLRARDVADVLAALSEGARSPDAPFLTHAVLSEARRRRRAGGEAPRVPTPPTDGRRVLLVEDHDINARVATRMLQRLGCAVTWARGGAEGLEAAASGKHDLVLLDLRMPDLDGYEVVTALRRREGDGPHVPVVAMTADVTDEDRARCQACGMDGFLAKPVDMRVLSEVVDRFCRRTAAT